MAKEIAHNSESKSWQIVCGSGEGCIGGARDATASKNRHVYYGASKVFVCMLSLLLPWRDVNPAFSSLCLICSRCYTHTYTVQGFHDSEGSQQ